MELITQKRQQSGLPSQPPASTADRQADDC